MAADPYAVVAVVICSGSMDDNLVAAGLESTILVFACGRYPITIVGYIDRATLIDLRGNTKDFHARCCYL
jgi:hypothetical protein